jgi:hypothetical protein
MTIHHALAVTVIEHVFTVAVQRQESRYFRGRAQRGRDEKSEHRRSDCLLQQNRLID